MAVCRCAPPFLYFAVQWFILYGMKKLIAFFSILLSLVIAPLTDANELTTYSSEYISSFSSDITINKDTSVTITEVIEYHTTEDKHGIYRYIPYKYNDGGTIKIMDVEAISVTDETGKVIPFTVDQSDKFVSLQIGDPDTTFVGTRKYSINYTVGQAIDEYLTYVELYWDITGEGWQFPILKSQATIRSPYADIQKIICYSGAGGSTDQNCEEKIIDNQTARFTYSQPIAYGDNMTVALQLSSANSLVFPTTFEKKVQWLWNNWILMLLPLPTIVFFGWWYKKGRDYEFISANVFEVNEKNPQRLRSLWFKRRKPFVYEPLKGITAGEAGALIDEKVDSQDVIAELLELARKKFIKIELIETKKLFGTKRDYKISQLKKMSVEVPEVQKYLYEKLFAQKNVVTVSELKGTFYLTMQEAAKKLEASLVSKKVYVTSPTTARAYAVLACIFLFAGLFSGIIFVYADLNILWTLAVLLPQLPVCMLLAYNMPQKTAVGTNLWSQARGLQQSIKNGKWREEIKEKNLFIEEVLPFAVSLGVVNQLAKQMKALNIQPPKYMHAAGMTTWNTQQFVSGFSNEVASSLAYNPSSSSSSGGSGFGGGSSGGGGGGGGGGSW